MTAISESVEAANGSLLTRSDGSRTWVSWVGELDDRSGAEIRMHHPSASRQTAVMSW